MRRERERSDPRAWAAALTVLLAIACAHTVPAAPQTPQLQPAVAEKKAPAEPRSIVPEDERNPSAEQVAEILRHAGFNYSTVAPGRRWRVTFVGHSQPTVSVDVVYTDHFTVVLARLFTMPVGAGGDIYRAIAERNFDLEQMKLSVDPSGVVFASFEVPTRILDRRELLENIVSLAAAVDHLRLDEPAPPAPEAAPEPKIPTEPIQKISWPAPSPLPDQTL